MEADWTERSFKDYLFQIGFDFISQLEKKMKSEEMARSSFAKKLNLSKGRISQILNSPGNLTLLKAIEYSRAVGMKVSLIAYDDGDPENKRGPINSEIFRISWEKAGKPKDFWAFKESPKTATNNLEMPSSTAHFYDAKGENGDGIKIREFNMALVGEC